MASTVRTTDTLKQLGRYVIRQPVRLALVSLCTAGAAALTLLAPYLLGAALDDYIIPGKREGLLRLCFIMLGMYALSSLAGWLQAFILADVSQRTVWGLRRDLFAHLQKLPLSFFASRNQGELMSRTTNDIDNVSNTLNQSLVQLISSVIMLVGSFTMMLVLNVWLTLVALVIIPLIVFVTKRIARVTQRQFKGQQQELGALNGFIEETVSGHKIVALFHQEERAGIEFRETNERLRKAGTRAQIYSGMMGPMMNLMGHVSYLLIAAAGAWLALRDLATVGVIISFLAYSKQFSGPLNEVANQYNLIQAGVAGAERVFETMAVPSEYDDHANDGETLRMRLPDEVKGRVEFRKVCFQYAPGKETLTDISFTAEPGQTVALVGPTGAGKTTIIQLIGRFFDPTEGQIWLDGQNIAEIDKDSLRSKLGIVLQDAHLFTGTIRDNIRYGRLDASDEEVETAAVQANAHPFITALPSGYDTVLTAEGGNVSHGQRQLITIARAILASPAILILDEATSSVDTLAELHIQQAMKTLLHGRTSFVIAHRLSTIRGADIILVVKDGEIAERGSHEQLLKLGGLYAELHGKQFAEEEDEKALV
ncbi:ABC transporter ATP-binding protein [Paenibacillus harenae]|uniref:ATP-binding cassette subfamily B protein n=1 Tax=Paenibacillus harenae TaxID=306543 RepID=A0ABT9U2D6_PAEHA|nr:ABC transporter ATP-binding protein [Paenibacillus harenae]MDQ0113427.1 ATP-binding cassette subfamily B protein [Paenibacillus harenae]